MRLHRFYITEKVGARTEITIHSTELVNQVRRVFRLKSGDSLVIFSGTGFDYECKIDGFGESNKIKSDNEVRLHVATTKRSAFSPARNIYLCASVVKKDNFEWIAEKATELGVTHIIPVMSERSEKKALNEPRLKKIAVEASEQSGRGDVPQVLPIMSLQETISFLKSGAINNSDEPGVAKKKEPVNLIAFHTEGKTFSENKPDAKSPLALFIGPEGGWSPSEIERFHNNNIPVLCLGSQILRSETAVIAALSQVVFSK